MTISMLGNSINYDSASSSLLSITISMLGNSIANYDASFLKLKMKV